ncbi:hypothetical protein N9988_00090 [bacterium]|jgi:hypothetical protein|nr:hypothetical protein [bacterium]
MKKIIVKLFKEIEYFINGLIAALEDSAYENEVKKDSKKKK